MNKMYKIDNEKIFREPDEAYIIIYKTGRQVIKFVEAKTQNVEGSVDIKLLASPMFVEEYKIALDNKFEIEYLLCLDTYFQKEFEKKDKIGKTSKTSKRKDNKRKDNKGQTHKFKGKNSMSTLPKIICVY